MKLIRSIYPEFNRSVNIILLGILITNISTFMLNAFLTVYMSNQLKYDPGSIGIVLTVLLVSQRGFTFFGGLLADKFGVKKIMIIGLLFRSIGYFSYLFASNVYLLLLSSILVGLGGALKDPALSACLALFSGEKRIDAFAYKGIVGNIAAAIGPLIGTVLYPVSYDSIFILTSVTHLIFVFIIGKTPYGRNEESYHPVKLEKYKASTVRLILKDKKLIKLTLMTIGFWYLYTQLNLTIPLYVSDFFSDASLIGLVYSINGFLAIAFQYNVLKVLQKKLKNEQIIVLGHALFSLSFGVIACLSDQYALIVFAVLFSAGGMCIIPLIDDLTAAIASETVTASYLGFVSFGWAIGGALGNMTGGRLYDFFYQKGTVDLLWLSFFIIGFIATILILIFTKKAF